MTTTTEARVARYVDLTADLRGSFNALNGVLSDLAFMRGMPSEDMILEYLAKHGEGIHENLRRSRAALLKLTGE